MSTSPPIGAGELRPLDHRVICCDNDLEALGQLERGPTGGGEICCDRPRLIDKSGGSHARHTVHFISYVCISVKVGFRKAVLHKHLTHKMFFSVGKLSEIFSCAATNHRHTPTPKEKTNRQTSATRVAFGSTLKQREFLFVHSRLLVVHRCD